MSLSKNGQIDQKALSVTGFKTADKILTSWGCSTQQVQRILSVSSSSYHEFKAAPEKANLNDAQIERVSYILNMHSALRAIFSNPVNVKGFMSLKNNNDFFAGRRPLEIIASGKFGDLYEVAKRIEALRSGG